MVRASNYHHGPLSGGDDETPSTARSKGSSAVPLAVPQYHHHHTHHLTAEQMRKLQSFDPMPWLSQQASSTSRPGGGADRVKSVEERLGLTSKQINALVGGSGGLLADDFQRVDSDEYAPPGPRLGGKDSKPNTARRRSTPVTARSTRTQLAQFPSQTPPGVPFLNFSHSTPIRAGLPQDQMGEDSVEKPVEEESRKQPTWSGFVGHREAVEQAESGAWRLEESKPDRPSPYRRAASPPPTQPERDALNALLNPKIGSWSRQERHSPRRQRLLTPNEQLKELKGQLAQAHALLEYQRLQMHDFAIKAEEAVTMQGAASLEILCTLLNQQQQQSAPTETPELVRGQETIGRETADAGTDTDDLNLRTLGLEVVPATAPPSKPETDRQSFLSRIKNRFSVKIGGKLTSRLRHASWLEISLFLFIVAVVTQCAWILMNAWAEDPEKMMFLLAKLVPISG